MLIVLFAVVFVAHFFWLLAALAATVAIAVLLGKWLARCDDRAEARRRRDAELCARADQRHAWALARDDRGIYGDYTPLEGYDTRKQHGRS